MNILSLKNVLVFLFMLVSVASQAQQIDSVWFNKKWEETTVPQEYRYLRTIKVVDEANSSFEVIDYYPDGTIQMKGYYSSIKPEIKNGEFLYYSDAGSLTTKNIWVNNMVAETFAYDATGKQTLHVVKREYLETLSAQEKLEKYGINEIDRHPVFPGGEGSFNDFLFKNIVYPPDAVQEKIEGRVIIAATIDASGKLTDVRLAQGAHPLLDKEALRVAALLPKKKWTPAQDKGKNISADFTFPILFRL